ncbi:hypothetical protein VOI45_00085, partial [Acidaminococcus fermentans]|nr:hypothetical protein [Acidaminococcus fermentans]MEE4121479.1 hypothetical protein [Acidaminococcus fermentans]
DLVCIIDGMVCLTSLKDVRKVDESCTSIRFLCLIFLVLCPIFVDKCKTNRKVFLAYIMLKDVNDSDRHAEQLTKLLFKHKKYLPLYHLDLIPYNQTTVTETMVPSSHTRIKAFCRIIHNAGISVNIRTQFGSDINAACGQLAGAYRDDQKQGERTMSARDVKSFGEEVEASC